MAHLFHEDLVTGVLEEPVLDRECGSLSTSRRTSDELASNDSRFHAPIIVLADIPEAPPNSWMIGFVILVIRGLGRMVSRDLDAVQRA